MRAEKPMTTHRPKLCIVVGSLLILAAATAGATEGLRPEIVVADPAAGCPSAAGAFVVLLDPARGMLILSGAPFPGGHPAGDARGGELEVVVPGVRGWRLERASSEIGQTPLWAARYPFLGAKGSGCVSFDRELWSSEGDLVTYARWLVEEVYLQLPAAERQRRPDLRLADRELSLRVEREGFGPVHLSGREGTTLACRYSDGPRLYLFMPFLLDEPAGRVAVQVAATEGSYFDTTAKTTLGWVVAAPEEPGTLADAAITVVVEGVVSSGGG
jgi:hypothetical protein